MALVSSSQMLTQAARNPRQTAPRVSTDQEAKISESLANKSLGWVASLGNFLSLPQSMVMDTINLRNPFDQLLTPFSSENRTTGKDLLRNLKLAGDKDTLGNTVSGIAVDILTDPLTYMTLGASAVGKGGKAAKALGVMGEAEKIAAGKLATRAGTSIAEAATKVGPRQARMMSTLNEIARSTADDVGSTFTTNLEKYATKQGYKSGADFLAKHGDEPLGGLVGIGLPFVGNQAVVGTGAKAQAYAAGADALGRAVSASYPVRMVKQLFHAPAKGLSTTQGQELGSLMYGSEQTLKPLAREHVFDAAVGMRDLEPEFVSMFGRMPTMAGSTPAETAAKQSENLSRFARFYYEGGFRPDTVDKASEQFFRMPDGEMAGKFSPDFVNRLDNLVNANRAAVDQSADKLRQLGVDVGKVDDFVDATNVEGNLRYNMRNISTSPGRDALFDLVNKHKNPRVAAMSADFMRQRNETLRHVPAEILERIYQMTYGPGGSLNNRAYAIAIRQATEPLQLGFYKDELTRLNGAIPSPKEVLDYAKQRARNLVESSAADTVAQRYGGWLDTNSPKVPVDVDGVRKFDTPSQWALDIVKVFNGFAPTVKQRIRSGGTLYDDYLTSFDKYLQGANRVESSAQSILEAFARDAKSAVGHVDAPDIARPMDELLKASIENFRAANNGVSPTDSQMAGLVQAAKSEALRVTKNQELLPEAIKRAGFTLPDNAMEWLSRKLDIPVDQLNQRMVHTGYVDAAKSVLDVSTKTKSTELLRALIEGGTQVIKENLTLPFLSFFSRNFVGSTLFMNYMSGEIDTLDDVTNLMKSIAKVREIEKNPDKHAARLREMFIHGLSEFGYSSRGVANVRISKAVELLPPSPLDFKTTLNEARATPPITIFEDKPHVVRLAADYLQGSLDPKSFEAGKKAIESGMSVFEKARAKLRVGHQFALRTGEKANAKAELYARTGLFNFLVDYKGYSPTEAARRVRQVHVDYSDLAPFEKDYLRTLFPFYTFARKQMTETLGNIAQHPGGAIASTIKGMNRLRDPNGLTPDYVAETASIPLGEDAEGNKNYLTGFGLAFEDPLSFFGKGVRGAGLEALSRMNPLVKGPLEYFTGQTFFQSTPEGGRPMYDADPVLGRFISNITGDERPYRVPGGQLTESFISNSPLSRYLTTARTLTDTRKDAISKLVNAATGVRIATISPQASEAILRERAQSALRDSGGKAFVRAYVPDNVKAGMSPQELQEAADLEALLNTLAERARKRKKQKAAANS